MLPNFLVIGAMRSGTTWLDSLLRSHPQVFLPLQRKEVHFFDQHYQRGMEWYAQFFELPSNHDSALHFEAVGEVTPSYLYVEECPRRIAASLPDCKLIAILRNPVDRAYSHYWYARSHRHLDIDFETFLLKRRDVFERGLYARQLGRYWERFPREALLVLIFERAISQPEAACRQLADFLGIDRKGFGTPSSRPLNASFVPRLPGLFKWAVRGKSRLRDLHLDRVVNIVKRSFLRKLLGWGEEPPKLSSGLAMRLWKQYQEEVSELEQMLNTKLSSWKPEDQGRGQGDETSLPSDRLEKRLAER